MDPVVADEEQDDEYAIGAWQGSPSATFTCAEDGGLFLERIELEAWQAIRVPRNGDDPMREPDEPPDEQLDRMLGRARMALYIRREVLDHLIPRTGHG